MKKEPSLVLNKHLVTNITPLHCSVSRITILEMEKREKGSTKAAREEIREIKNLNLLREMTEEEGSELQTALAVTPTLAKNVLNQIGEDLDGRTGRTIDPRQPKGRNGEISQDRHRHQPLSLPPWRAIHRTSNAS
jgi:hypothetical protein